MDFFFFNVFAKASASGVHNVLQEGGDKGSRERERERESKKSPTWSKYERVGFAQQIVERYKLGRRVNFWVTAYKHNSCQNNGWSKSHII